MPLTKIQSLGITDGTIVNADINASAAIAGTKLSGAGKVLQVVSTFKSDTATTSSTSFADVGLSASITPSSASNKILVLSDAKFGGASGNLWYVQFVRNSTIISNGDASATRISCNFATDGTGQSIHIFNVGLSFLDSPSTTSSTTYKLQFRSRAGAAVYLNRTGQDRDGEDGRTGSSITLMEIAV